VLKTRVVKRSLDLQTSNFKFEFVFVSQPFDIPIQASLIRLRWFCLESGALSWLIALLIDCFPACGVCDVTFISLHSADNLLKILHKYINEVQI